MLLDGLPAGATHDHFDVARKRHYAKVRGILARSSSPNGSLLAVLLRIARDNTKLAVPTQEALAMSRKQIEEELAKEEAEGK